MKTRSSLVVLLLPALALAGCASAFHLQKPTYAIRQIKPRVSLGIPISSSSIDFDMRIDVTNPNSIGLRVDRIDFDLSSNDRHLLKGTSEQTTLIPAHGTGTLLIAAHVAYVEIRPLFRELAAAIEGGGARYTLVGTVHYHTPFGERQLPFNATRGARK